MEVVEILLFVDLGDYKFYVELTSINIYKFLYFYIYLYLIGAYHTYFMPIIEPHLIIDLIIIIIIIRFIFFIHTNSFRILSFILRFIFIFNIKSFRY